MAAQRDLLHRAGAFTALALPRAADLLHRPPGHSELLQRLVVELLRLLLRVPARRLHIRLVQRPVLRMNTFVVVVSAMGAMLLVDVTFMIHGNRFRYRRDSPRRRRG